MNLSPWISPPRSGNVSVTGGTLTGTNVPYTLLQSGLPFVAAPTGTMANNGAVTLGTVLDATYSDGVWMLFPAGAVAAGVPAAAAWLWVVMSSTSVGTVYNSTYTTGAVSAGTTTAFVTTGPGAFTGVTAATVGPNISLAGNSLGTNGQIDVEILTDATNNANTKTVTSKLGGTSFSALNSASTVSYHAATVIANRGAANRQVSNQLATSGGWGSSGSNTIRGSEDTTGALTFALVITRSTATDAYILSAFRVRVGYANP